MIKFKYGLVGALAATLLACGGDDDVASPAPPRPDAGQVDAIDSGTRADAAPSNTDGRADAAAEQAPDDGKLDAGKQTDAGAGKDAAAAKDATSPKDGSTPQTPDAGGEQGPECGSCEAENADKHSADFSGDLDKLCESLGDEVAIAGSAKGKLKRELCQTYVDCAVKTGCGASNPAIVCLCGDVGYDACSSLTEYSQLTGACKREYFEAAEAIDIPTALERAQDPSSAVGAANYRLLFTLSYCSDECFGYCKGKPDYEACAGGPLDPANLPADGAAVPGFCHQDSCEDAPQNFNL